MLVLFVTGKQSYVRYKSGSPICSLEVDQSIDIPLGSPSPLFGIRTQLIGWIIFPFVKALGLSDSL